MYEANWQKSIRRFKVWRLDIARGGDTTQPRPSLVLFSVWLLLLASGVGALSCYEFTGVASVSGPDQWPEGTVLALDAARPVLVFFMHPRCPCTAASIAELDRSLSQNAGRFRAYAVVTIPPGAGPRWEEGRNLNAAQRLPGTTLVFDRGGALTRRFGAVDSGTLLAFDASGARLFAGGITGSRGHEGECTGSQALRAIAAGQSPSQSSSPVFGCPLLSANPITEQNST